MKLIDVYSRDDRHELLYRLLQERDGAANISHKSMPKFEDHVKFVESKPYAMWFFLLNDDDEVVGACYLSKQNEIGIFVFRAHRRKGYAEAGLRLFMQEQKPLAAIPSVRAAGFLANINPKNEASIALFEKLGFTLRQVVYGTGG